MLSINQRSLAVAAGAVLFSVAQLAIAGSPMPKLVINQSGYTVGFQTGPSSDPISLVGKTTVRVTGADKMPLPKDTYTFKADEGMKGLTRLTVYLADKAVGTIMVDPSKSATFSAMSDAKNVKQSTPTSDIKLGSK